VSLCRAFVIGDTPHDIVAGNAIGARTVAVASGSYSAAALSACEPWVVVDRLPDVTAFEKLIAGP
jgi:phosphoglycolate phosphatase-like HAD superfamily hydrolase